MKLKSGELGFMEEDRESFQRKYLVVVFANFL